VLSLLLTIEYNVLFAQKCTQDPRINPSPNTQLGLPRLPRESVPIEHYPTADHDGRQGYYLGHGDVPHPPGIGALHLQEEAAQGVKYPPQEEDISPEKPLPVSSSNIE